MDLDAEIESRENLLKMFKTSFPLAKRIEQGAERFDVHVFLSIIKKHRLFGSSFSDDLLKLFRVLKIAESAAKKTRLISHHASQGKLKAKGAATDMSTNLQTLFRCNEQIARLEMSILDDLQKGHEELISLQKKIIFLESNSKELEKLLVDRHQKMDDLNLIPDQGEDFIESQVDVMSGDLHIMRELIDSIAGAYDNEFVIVKQMISHEISKIEEFIVEDIKAVEAGEKKPLPEVNFDQILAHIRLVQTKLDRIIGNLEKENKLGKKLKKKSTMIYELLAHKNLPGMMAAKDKRIENIRKKSRS